MTLAALLPAATAAQGQTTARSRHRAPPTRAGRRRAKRGRGPYALRHPGKMPSLFVRSRA